MSRHQRTRGRGGAQAPRSIRAGDRRSAFRLVPLAPVVVAALLLPGCARLGGEALVASHNAVLPVTEETSVGQTFTLAGSAVLGVDVLVATFAAPADPAGVLTVSLLTEHGGELVDVAEVPGSEIQDNSWVAVRFEGPHALEGRPAFEATWQGASRLALRANVPSHPIDPRVLVNDPYPGGELVVDGELAAGDLAFRVVGADGLAALPRTLTGLARGVGSGLLDRPLFGLAWLLALVGCGALAVWGLGRRRAPIDGGEAAESPRPAAPARRGRGVGEQARQRRGRPATRSRR